jgi:type IV pilus assembly protein PilE
MLKSKYKQCGFTLIEVMIVVAIIGILSAVAYPSYRQYVIASQRSVAKSTVLDVAARQNQYYSNNKTYTADLADLGLTATYYVDGNGSSTSANALYQMTIASGSSLTFDITATPQGSLATDDTECARYTMDETGAKGVSGSGGVDNCW